MYGYSFSAETRMYQVWINVHGKRGLRLPASVSYLLISRWESEQSERDKYLYLPSPKGFRNAHQQTLSLSTLFMLRSKAVSHKLIMQKSTEEGVTRKTYVEDNTLPWILTFPTLNNVVDRGLSIILLRVHEVLKYKWTFLKTELYSKPILHNLIATALSERSLLDPWALLFLHWQELTVSVMMDMSNFKEDKC